MYQIHNKSIITFKPQMRLKIQVPISKIIAMHVSNMSNETFMLMNLGIIVEKIVVRLPLQNNKSLAF